jgi:hypothetical protein
MGGRLTPASSPEYVFDSHFTCKTRFSRWNLKNAYGLVNARAGRSAAVHCRGDRRAGRGTGGLYWLVAGVIFSIFVALFDAWVLLLEINR